MTRRVCFLFNHEEVHQIAHTLPVARQLAMAAPDISIDIAISSASQERVVREFLQGAPEAARLNIVRLGLGQPLEFLTSALSKIFPARRIAILARNLDYFSQFDALVVPEFTSTLLKSRWNMTKPALICIPHGSGDRSVGFSDELNLFDLILVAGDKTRDRMVARHPQLAERISVCGYPKFDALDLSRKVRLFDNDRPTVLYNPHFDPRLSSWYRFGPQVLDYFAKQDRYNLIFAPHVMLFRKAIHGSLEHRDLRFRGHVPERYRHLPHIRIDTGSDRSIDMTYTLAGDIYLGDVSSQIYEWLVRLRPAIFLNSHDAAWQTDPNYAHWQLGEVIDDVAELGAALGRIEANPDAYRTAQEQARAITFAQSDIPASRRCADAIAGFLATRD